MGRAIQHMDRRPTTDFGHQEPNNRPVGSFVQSFLGPSRVTHEFLIGRGRHKAQFGLLLRIRLVACVV